MEEIIKLEPTLDEEKQLWLEGRRMIAGVDEVGVGPVAGPVVAAAVILPLPSEESQFDDLAQVLAEIKDSKRIHSEKKLARLYNFLLNDIKVVWSIAVVEVEEINRTNTTVAAARAMRLAVEKLQVKPDFVLVDGQVGIEAFPAPARAITGGDAKCLSIAAASIVAKFSRNTLMVELAKQYPAYLFEKHKGYGTLEHKELINKYGTCLAHHTNNEIIKKFRKTGNACE